MINKWVVEQKTKQCPKCEEVVDVHIIKDGARYHVTSYDTLGAHCSAENCERNHKCEEA